MARAVDLVTNGAGEGIYYVLQAMASLFHGGKSSYMGSILVVASGVSAVIIAYMMVIKQQLQITFNWLLTNSLIIATLTIPTATVTIIDKITGFRMPVANVPWIFAVPAGYVSQIGDMVATQIDNVFKQPSSAPSARTFKEVITANRNGVAMTARLAANAAHFDFVSNDMASNMREYVKECVYYDIALGKYTIEQLKNTDDIWKLVSERASPLGGVIYQQTNSNGTANNLFLTCSEAATRIEAAWPNEVNRALEYYGKKLFPYGGPHATGSPNRLLRENLVHAYDYLIGVSKTADEIMQQNIMRNAIQDGFLARAQVDGATASVQSYAATRAEAYQESVYGIQGNIAEKAISYMKIVIEIIFYGMFPFVAIMLVMPAGGVILRTYFTGLVWLQSWAPLYSLINMILHVYSRSDAVAASTTLAGPMLTFDTIPALGAAGESIARYAGYAMMSVPFLSWGLFKYGGGALANLSTHLGQPIQSASGMAAQEAITGNISQGNRQFDSTSRSLVNSFKQDESASISSGAISIMTASGSTLTGSTSGNAIVNRANSLSRLGIGIGCKNDIVSSMSTQAGKSLSQAETSLNSYSTSLSSAYDQIQDFRNSYGSSLSNDSSIGMDESSSINKSFQQLDDVVDSYSRMTGLDKKHAIDDLTLKSKNVRVSGGVDAGGSLGKLVGLKGGVELSASAEGRHQSTLTDVSNINENANRQLQYAEKFTESLDAVNRAFQSESVRNSSSEAANFSDGLSSRLSEAATHRTEAQNSLTESQSWQEHANLVSSSSLSLSDDLSQEFVNFAALMPGASSSYLGAGGVESDLNDPGRRSELIDAFVKSKRQDIVHSFSETAPSTPDTINSAAGGTYRSSDVLAHHSQTNQQVHAASEEKNLFKGIDSGVAESTRLAQDINQDVLSKHAETKKIQRQGSDLLKDRVRNKILVKED